MAKKNKQKKKKALKKLRSCGFLIYRHQPHKQFLLMKHTDRWDLPKGHVDPGETDLECALRELDEETGITENDIEMHESFRFELQYQVRYKRSGGEPMNKTLLIFLAGLVREVELVLTEHLGYEWFDWEPGLKIQELTIDPLLAKLDEFWTDTDLTSEI